MKYKQLTLEKRYQISALIKAGLNQKKIAVEIGVHPSTISREVRRNRDEVRGYNSDLAQNCSWERGLNEHMSDRRDKYPHIIRNALKSYN